jgi:nitroreductase/ubiquinone/menaquinone biosynthesis C-methylase UbiE
MDFTALVRARVSARTFQPTPVPRDLVREILALAQWAPSSCNLQLTQCLVVDDPGMLKTLTEQADKKFSWAPCLLLLAYDPRINRGRDATQVSLGGIMQTILLAATERGLASCPMAGFKGDEVIKRILHIPSHMELGLMVALGYPVEGLKTSKDRARNPLEQFVHWNAYDTTAEFSTVSIHADRWSMRDLRSYRERMAPVYLYNDHNRLSSFSESVLQSIVQRCEKSISMTRPEVLDLCTYDGAVLRALRQAHPQWSYYFADHVSYVGGVHERCMPGARFVKMSDGHHLDLPDASVDVVTCFHKLEFTPQWEGMLKEAVRVLRPGGSLLVTTMKRSFVREMLQAVRSRWKRRGPRNVYDGNPYYKIGPYAYRSFSNIRRVGMEAGLFCQDTGTESTSGGGALTHRYTWGVFVKKK